MRETDPKGLLDEAAPDQEATAWAASLPALPTASQPGVPIEGGDGTEEPGSRPTAGRMLPGLPVRRQAAEPVTAAAVPLGGGASHNAGLYQYVRPLVRWWWLILISAAIGAVSGYLGARQAPQQYQSRTTLMVGQAMQDPNPSTTEFYTGQVLAQSYADLVKREPVLRGTLDALGLDWNWAVLQNMVTSRVVPGTQLLEISVLDTDPQRVQVLTYEIAQQLILQSPATNDPEREAERQFVQSEIIELKSNIQNSRAEIKNLDEVIANSNSARQIEDARARQASLQNQITSWEATYAQLLTNLQKGTSNFLSIVEPAQASLRAVGAGTGVNVLLGLAMGLVLSAGAAFLLEFIDDTVKTDEDVRQTVGLMTLGRLPRQTGPNGVRKPVVTEQSRSPAASAYRVLRTNLQFCSIDHPLNTLIITSAGPREGKSTIAANLATTLAQTGQRVILVDADLWRPTQHLIFNLTPDIGLTNLLVGDANLDEVLKSMPLDNLQVLPAGPLPPNPSDLLSSRRMGYLIETLCEQADIVIFDTPPVLVDADAAILAARVDGVVLVIDAGTTRRTALRRSREALSAVGAHVAGVALNRVREQSQSYAYYYAAAGLPPSRPSPRVSLLAFLKNARQKLATRPSENELPVKSEAVPDKRA